MNDDPICNVEDGFTSRFDLTGWRDDGADQSNLVQTLEIRTPSDRYSQVFTPLRRAVSHLADAAPPDQQANRAVSGPFARTRKTHDDGSREAIATG
jgi:hypothetical protein